MDFSRKVSLLAATAPFLAVIGCDLNSASNNPQVPANPQETVSLNSSASTEPSTNNLQPEVSTVPTLEDLPNCTPSRKDETAYVSDKQSVYICSDERWIKSDITPPVDSIPPITSSDEKAVIESSSSVNDTIIVINDPALPVPGKCFETWNGYDQVYQVNTGLDNGSETSGIWYTYSDDADGGVSRIEWYVPMGDYPWMIDPIIDACNGVCGTYILEKGNLSYDPFVALGFNVAGLDENGNTSIADASSWGGITVTYTSEMNLTMELALGEVMDREVGYDRPSVLLPKTISAMTKTFTWSSFKQAGWSGKAISGEEAARILAGIHFRFQGKDGSKGRFNIMSVGPLDTKCSYVSPVDPPAIPSSSSITLPKSSSSIRSSSSVTPKSSSSASYSSNVVPCGEFETWYGANLANFVMTGCDAGRETSGYWFEYSDELDGGKSYIEWPSPLGNEYDDKAFDPVIEQCDGICGTFHLNRGSLEYDPFVGVGFDLAGLNDNNEIALADASTYQGICISYFSDAAATLEMSLGNEKDQELNYDVPYVNLPKSAYGTTKSFTWQQFKQAGWGSGLKITGDEAAKTLASLKFKIQGKNGTSGKFNIMSIGPYNGQCAPSNVAVLP